MDQLRTYIVGDSGLRLKKSKGTSDFLPQWRQILGPNARIVSFPGEGASAITRYLHRIRSDAQAVVVVWFLNELFTSQWRLIDEYPAYLDALAEGLADALGLFPRRAAVIGGCARLWNVSGKFDSWAERLRGIVSRRGIHVVSGEDLYSLCGIAGDRWHVRSTPRNKAILASYFASLLWEIVS